MMQIERRRINTMMEVLKVLFPSQMHELENAKRRFDRACVDYDAALKKSDQAKAQMLIEEMQKARRWGRRWGPNVVC